MRSFSFSTNLNASSYAFISWLLHYPELIVFPIIKFFSLNNRSNIVPLIQPVHNVAWILLFGTRICPKVLFRIYLILFSQSIFVSSICCCNLDISLKCAEFKALISRSWSSSNLFVKKSSRSWNLFLNQIMFLTETVLFHFLNICKFRLFSFYFLKF